MARLNEGEVSGVEGKTGFGGARFIHIALWLMASSIYRKESGASVTVPSIEGHTLRSTKGVIERQRADPKGTERQHRQAFPHGCLQFVSAPFECFPLQISVDPLTVPAWCPFQRAKVNPCCPHRGQSDPPKHGAVRDCCQWGRYN